MKGDVKKRIVSYDYVRTLAICLVVLNHGVEFVYLTGFDTLSTASKIFESLMFFIGRLGVPLFLFLTGALLLKRPFETGRDIFDFYKKNLLPMVISYVAVTIIYYIFIVVHFGVEWDTEMLLHYLLMIEKFPLASMWYPPMIIGTYLAVPFLAIIVKKFSMGQLKIVMWVVFFFRFLIPTLNPWWVSLGFKPLGYVIDLNLLGSAYVLYVVLGYYITEHKILRNVKSVVMLSVMAVGIVLGVWLQITLSGCNDNGTYYHSWYDSVFLLMAAVSLFELMLRCRYRRWGIITYISRISYGIFLVHIIYCELLKGSAIVTCAGNPIGTAIMTALVGVLSLTTVGVLSLIRPIGKYLFLIKK